MFFLASKTIGVLLIPSNFISLVGVVGLILFRTRYASIGRKLVCTCVAAYVICGFSPLGNLLLVPLETRFPPWNAGKGEPDGMIVLGGAIDPDLSAAGGAGDLAQARARSAVVAGWPPAAQAGSGAVRRHDRCAPDRAGLEAGHCAAARRGDGDLFAGPGARARGGR